MSEKLHFVESSLQDRVLRAVHELGEANESLRGLAESLDHYLQTSANSTDEELKMVAIGVRASAVQALLTCTTIVGLSERFATYGRVLEMANADEDGGFP